jgi:hypothetical protein
MKRKKPKHSLVYSKLKKKAPRVPDITCPDIDSIITRLEKHLNTNATYTEYRHRRIVKIMEKLRTANELLRESGIYWNSACKELIIDVYKKKKI